MSGGRDRALPGLGMAVRVLLSLLVASLIVAWLASTRLPRAIQPAPPSAAPDVASAKPPAAALPEHGKLYIWRDERGATHIASEAPPAHVSADVVPFVRRPKAGDRESGAGTPLPAAAAHGPAPVRHPFSVYTPEGFDALMEQVDQAARQLEERNRRVEELAKQL